MFATEPVENAGLDSIGFLMRKHVIIVTVKEKNEKDKNKTAWKVLEKV